MGMYKCPTHGIGDNPSCCDLVTKRSQMKNIPGDAVDHDPVNHPSHYTAYSGLEIIDLTEQMNFNRGNAVKYITRAGFKGDDKTEIEDLKKARWYLDREIERITPLNRLTKEWADDG